MDQIILDPEPEPKYSRCRSQKNLDTWSWSLKLELRLHRLDLSNQHITLSRHVASNCKSLNHGIIRRTARVGIYGTYMSSCTFMYLYVVCYCDTCLKSSALRVGVKTLTQNTMSTGSLTPILFTSKMHVWTFWPFCFNLNRYYLVILDNWLKTE